MRRKDLKTQQSPVILDLCLRKTRSGKSRDYRFRKTPFSVHHRTKSYVRVSEILVSRCVSATLSRVSAVFQFAGSWDFVLYTRKRKAGDFKFLLFEERFRKAPARRSGRRVGVTVETKLLFDRCERRLKVFYVGKQFFTNFQEVYKIRDKTAVSVGILCPEYRSRKLYRYSAPGFCPVKFPNLCVGKCNVYYFGKCNVYYFLFLGA